MGSEGWFVSAVIEVVQGTLPRESTTIGPVSTDGEAAQVRIAGSGSFREVRLPLGDAQP